ncbi:hypothetical protein LEP1GSC087_1458 [Leptospira interrogans serovar Bataviae str. L1111]|nr:hypothetical protein LEP1GSC087_1458 [Leptospira interrogans serovar Bataviae str. L1111]
MNTFKYYKIILNIKYQTGFLKRRNKNCDYLPLALKYRTL